MMNLDALLNALGYLRADNHHNHWMTPENADPRLTYHYRLAARAGVIGSYVYHTSLDDKLTPPRPAVHVASAANKEEAQIIHRRLWNLGDCPLVLIVLPGSVRVYAGFRYDVRNPDNACIADPQDSLLGLPESLQPFHADEIDSGRIWEQQAKQLTSETRVDFRLLKTLRELSKVLRAEYGLSPELTHALIGKYIYFHYLRDRGILDDDWLRGKQLRPEDIFGRNANADGFETLVNALQTRFNGDIFPIPNEAGSEWRHNDAISRLAGVFAGDETTGQLALDFQAYDFSFIPVELLSSIYEQFLKAEGRGEGDGIVYTPEPLADYVLSEMEAVHPLSLAHRILDPCCGSGVFLVLAYRRLLEMHRQQTGQRPTAEQMRHLLTAKIFGIEKDKEACDITAFSLILALLSQLEPPELHANEDFQFPTLVGNNIFHADFFDDACPVFTRNMRFDWIAGNPPWIPAKAPDNVRALAWIKAAEKTGRSVGGLRMDEAFTWRASDLLQEDGVAGLLIKATTLVNPTSAEYRKQFFTAQNVWRISNLSNFLRILFMGPEGVRAEAPAACLVYSKHTLAHRRKPILHFAPFVANQIAVRAKGAKRRAWTITIYEGDIQEIDYQDAIEDEPYIWKTASWGTFLDRRALRRLYRLMPQTIGEVSDERKWLLCQGLRVKPKQSKSKRNFVPAPELKGKNLLDMGAISQRGARFVIPDEAVREIEPERQFISDMKGLGLIPAPHLVVNATTALFSDQSFIIPGPQIGVAGSTQDTNLLKAVGLFLNSSVARYALFFSAAMWGVMISTISPEELRQIPFPVLTSEQINQLASHYDAFTQREEVYRGQYAPMQSPPFDVQEEIDIIIETMIGIPDRVSMIVHEFMQVRYQLLKGKTGTTAIDPPTPQQLEDYAEQLRLQIDDFAQRHYHVSITQGNKAIVATIRSTQEQQTVPVTVVTQEDAASRAILQAVRERHSQWAYVQRSVRMFDGSCVHIVKAPRLLDWTRPQALLDAADIVAEMLDKKSNYEPVTR